MRPRTTDWDGPNILHAAGICNRIWRGIELRTLHSNQRKKMAGPGYRCGNDLNRKRINGRMSSKSWVFSVTSVAPIRRQERAIKTD